MLTYYTLSGVQVPPKPEPKPCTKPSPFQLESLVRHEEEMQREMEERRRKEMEEEEMRKFRAQPILKEYEQSFSSISSSGYACSNSYLVDIFIGTLFQFRRKREFP